MVKVNASGSSSSPFGGPEPGTHFAEIAECTLKHSKPSEKSPSGEDYFSVKLILPDSAGEYLCHDNLMLGGGGATMGIAKLKTLGFFRRGEEEDIEPHQLVGKRVWVTVGNETYDGKTRLKVISTFRPEFKCGWEAEGNRKREAPPATFDPAVDDTPF